MFILLLSNNQLTGTSKIFIFNNDIRSHKKQGFIFSLEDTFLEKPQRGSPIQSPSLLKVNIAHFSKRFLTKPHIYLYNTLCKSHDFLILVLNLNKFDFFQEFISSFFFKQDPSGGHFFMWNIC